MEVLTEYLDSSGLYERLKEANIADTEEWKSDPENDPYRSKYKARKIWEDVKQQLESALDDLSILSDIRKCVMSSIDYRISVNSIETEEIQKGDDTLTQILDNVRHLKLDKLGFSVYCKSLTQMGFLCSIRGSHERALEYLVEAMNLYTEYKHLMESAPMYMNEFLSKCDSIENIEKERSSEMEDVYTHILYYIAQVHGHLGDKKESAHYCNITLKRQLESTTKFDPMDWSMNAAALSQYFVAENDFFMARHCLASASVTFDDVLAKNDENQSEDDKDELLRQKASIDRCWIKYGLALLDASQEKLIQDVERMDNVTPERVDEAINNILNDQSRRDNVEHDVEVENETETNKSLLFDLELTQHEEKITFCHVLDFIDARKVFLTVQEWIKTAQDYFTINEHCSDYIEIIQDHSRAFKLLSFFEVDLERQCRMEKRRIDMITALLHELNPQFYLMVCRQLMFELAETYSSMMELKLAIVEVSGTNPTSHVLNKINRLIQSSIDQYTAYLESLKGGKPDYPDEFPDTDVRPGLIAIFCVGRLYGKLMTSEKAQKVDNVRKSLECYNFFVDYCSRNPSSEELVKTELSVCKEMVNLLPLKIQKLISSDCDI